jgi:hypothetical protein
MLDIKKDADHASDVLDINDDNNKDEDNNNVVNVSFARLPVSNIKTSRATI